VIDPWGEQVDKCPTEEAGRQDIERCVKEDRMYETAKQLLDTATKAHMEMFDVDRETTRYWVCSEWMWWTQHSGQSVVEFHIRYISGR
jgi:hypothetical protein